MKLGFIASTVETRTDRSGKTFIKARGIMTRRKREATRTLVVPSWFAHRFDAMKPGVALTIEGKEQRFNTTDKDGNPIKSGLFIRAERVLKVLDQASNDNEGTSGHTLAGHERQGYYRRQRFGAGRAQTKMVWIASTKVNGGYQPDLGRG